MKKKNEIEKLVLKIVSKGQVMAIEGKKDAYFTGFASGLQWVLQTSGFKDVDKAVLK